MDRTQDPFRLLSLSYEADPEAVRRAFRRHARQTHPDRGGTAIAFHEVRAAYSALTRDLEAERRRWRPLGPPARGAARYVAGLDPRTYPTCPVRVSRSRDGTRVVAYDVDQRPGGWVPGAAPPPGGTCVARVDAAVPPFGVWTVPLDAPRFRCVFGPLPAEGA